MHLQLLLQPPNTENLQPLHAAPASVYQDKSMIPGQLEISAGETKIILREVSMVFLSITLLLALQKLHQTPGEKQLIERSVVAVYPVLVLQGDVMYLTHENQTLQFERNFFFQKVLSSINDFMLWLMRSSNDPAYKEIRRDMLMPLWKSVFPGKKLY